MKTIKPKYLNRLYEFVCDEYVKRFCKKQQIEFDGWVGHVGDIAAFGDQYFFNLSDLVLDLKTKQPKRTILNWQDEDVKYNMVEERKHINYKSYTMGLRLDQLKNEKDSTNTEEGK